MKKKTKKKKEKDVCDLFAKSIATFEKKFERAFTKAGFEYAPPYMGEIQFTDDAIGLRPIELTLWNPDSLDKLEDLDKELNKIGLGVLNINGSNIGKGVWYITIAPGKHNVIEKQEEEKKKDLIELEVLFSDVFESIDKPLSAKEAALVAEVYYKKVRE